MNCDPLTAMGCSAGDNCDLAIKPDRSRLYTECIQGGTGGYQAPCTMAQDCLPGFSCLKVSSDGGQTETQMCLQACVRNPTPSGCPGSEVCQPIDPPNMLGTNEWGWCY
jgi:hypothetical protein